jgi:hypothetical protein
VKKKIKNEVVGHVTYIGEKGISYRILVAKYEEK